MWLVGVFGSSKSYGDKGGSLWKTSFHQVPFQLHNSCWDNNTLNKSTRDNLMIEWPNHILERLVELLKSSSQQDTTSKRNHKKNKKARPSKNSPSETLLIFVCITDPGVMLDLPHLPTKKQFSRYIVWAPITESVNLGDHADFMRFERCPYDEPDLGACTKWHALFSARGDILYVNSDLSIQQCDNHNGALPGVVVPGRFHDVLKLRDEPDGHLAQQERPRLVSFAGRIHGGSWGSSTVRMDLCKGYDSWSTSLEGRFRKDVFMCCTHTNDNLYDRAKHEALLLNSKFCLAPRADARWSYRFIEALRAGCIPVLLSDGLEFPFAPLINWEVAAVRINESSASDFGAGIVGTLEKKLPHVTVMLQNTIDIYRRCFQTINHRVECLLLSLEAKLLEQKTSGRPHSPPVSVARNMFRPSCPTPNLRDSSPLFHHPSDPIFWNFSKGLLDRMC